MLMLLTHAKIVSLIAKFAKIKVSAKHALLAFCLWMTLRHVWHLVLMVTTLIVPLGAAYA